MLIPPLLAKFRMDCAVLIVTVLALMVAESAAPGTALHDQSPDVDQLPLAGIQVQLAPSAS